MSCQLQKFEFEGHALTVIEFKGEPVWIAKEVGAALGYADGSRLQRKINGDWSEEFIEGQDYIVLRGDDLAVMREFASPDSGLAKVRALTMLTETGINLAAMKTNKPVGRKMRRWLASDVLPSIRRTGTYSAPMPVETPDAREVRLMMRERRMMAKLQADVMLDMAKWLEAKGRAADGTAQMLRAKAVTAVTGEELPALLPAERETYYTAGDVARILSTEFDTVISANRIGRWANAEGLKVDGLGRVVTDKSAHSDKTVSSWQYNDRGVSELRTIAGAWVDAEAK